MKRSIAILAAVAALFLGGCGEALGKDQAEKIAADITKTGTELATKLAGITDADAAKAAKDSIATIATKFAGLQEKIAPVKTALGDAAGDLSGIVDKVKAAAGKLLEDAGIKEVLGESLAKLTK